MALLSRRFERLKSVLNKRMSDLTLLLENVEKPHNLSAILRTCDAVGVLETHAVTDKEKLMTFNSTAQGSQKWIKVNQHECIHEAIKNLKNNGFKLYGTNLGVDAIDYRDCDFTGPTAFVLGAEKWGLSHSATKLMDKSLFIPMRGMVQSLNVSVAASTLLFEALRQRQSAGLTPEKGEGMAKKIYEKKLFEWAYPEVADLCNKKGQSYPKLNSSGEIVNELHITNNMRF